MYALDRNCLTFIEKTPAFEELRALVNWFNRRIRTSVPTRRTNCEPWVGAGYRGFLSIITSAAVVCFLPLRFEHHHHNSQSPCGFAFMCILLNRHQCLWNLALILSVKLGLFLLCFDLDVSLLSLPLVSVDLSATLSVVVAAAGVAPPSWSFFSKSPISIICQRFLCGAHRLVGV
jgi:hypothetical protein